LELFAFNDQKFRGDVTLTTPGLTNYILSSIFGLTKRLDNGSGKLG